jgi:pseudaminic acid synthase
MKTNINIIAELSANHNNDFELAKDTIAAMKDSGADTVKFQTFTADSLSLDVDNEFFGPLKKGLWKGQRPYELFQKAAMKYEWQPKLAEYAMSLGLNWLSSPFDHEAVDFLESINIPAYKIASLEISDTPLIAYAASKGKPMIISTGVADDKDIQLAIDTCKNAGNEQITMLKCTSQYPAPIEEANLLTIPDMKQRFNVEVGVSDHTMGFIVPIVAVSLGAKVVEKHFILNRKLGGPDSGFSMEPAEFKQMADAVRDAEKALGKVTYNLTDSERARRRSLFVVKDIKKGEALTPENIRSVRPGAGLHPKHFAEVLGKTVKTDIKRGTPLLFKLLN